jgi:anthranilate synthase component I
MAFFVGARMRAEDAMIRPSRAEFKERAKQGNLIPVSTEITGDLETPVSAMLKLRRGRFNFLLESVEGGNQIGRYSFLGRDPFLVFRSKGRRVTIRRGADVTTLECDRPLDELARLLAEIKPVSDPTLPPFAGGAVGYIAYDVVRQYERLPDGNPDDLDVPDICFVFTDTVVAFDNVKHGMTVITNVRARPGDNLDLLYDQACGVVTQTAADLRRPLPAAATADGGKLRIGEKLRSGFTRPAFLQAVDRCKHYIREGDIIQVVLSQRLATTFEGDTFDLYRALRIVNPSPYLFFLELDDLTLVGASPEVHVKAQGRDVTIRPIAGTRPRGKTADEDAALARDLLADDKEKAEHLMLVDLARNDIGRVCDYGSVRVTDFQAVEHYSHVMHLVSNVVGRLADGKTAFDLIAATFPAGTVSGAPKIRAMEIIDELEPTRRGTYAGLVGYFDFRGNFDSCITIRTALIKDGWITVQVGAGIVADSEPEREYQETLNKARAMLTALSMARAPRVEAKADGRAEARAGGNG